MPATISAAAAGTVERTLDDGRRERSRCGMRCPRSSAFIGSRDTVPQAKYPAASPATTAANTSCHGGRRAGAIASRHPAAWNRNRTARGRGAGAAPAPARELRTSSCAPTDQIVQANSAIPAIAEQQKEPAVVRDHAPSRCGSRHPRLPAPRSVPRGPRSSGKSISVHGMPSVAIARSGHSCATARNAMRRPRVELAGGDQRVEVRDEAACPRARRTSGCRRSPLRPPTAPALC